MKSLCIQTQKRFLHYFFAIEFSDHLFGNNYIKEIKIDPLKIFWLTVDLWSPWWSSSFLPQRQHHHDLYQPNVKFLREFLDLIRFYETFQVELVRRCKLNTQWPPTTRRYRFFLLLNHLVAHYGSLKIEKALDISHKWKVCLIVYVSNNYLSLCFGIALKL